MSTEALREKAAKIRFLALDVDGTLTDGGVYIDANGLQSRKFNIKDGMGITLLQQQGIQVGLISHSRAEVLLQERARMLNVKHVYAGKEPKLEVLQQWMSAEGLSFEQVAYIGDDVNDLPVLEAVGLSACPADAHASLFEKVNVVLDRKGGDGCVRELIDRFLLQPLVD